MTDSKKPVPDMHDGFPPASPVNTGEMAHGVDMEHYRATVPLWKRVWQHSLTQMILLSIQSFCGPAMSDAITGLGGGGLATPLVSNISTAIRYAMLAISTYRSQPNCLLGGC